MTIITEFMICDIYLYEYFPLPSINSMCDGAFINYLNIKLTSASNLIIKPISV